MDPDCWNILHDGYIVDVAGELPGDVRLAVEIDYLRGRFAEPGNRIVLTLHDCTGLTYHPFDEPVIADFPAIAAAHPQILRARNWTDPGFVECPGGDLKVDAAHASFSLDGGIPLSLDQLKAAAEAYWTEFEERSNRPDDGIGSR